MIQRVASAAKTLIGAYVTYQVALSIFVAGLVCGMAWILFLLWVLIHSGLAGILHLLPGT